MAYSRIHLVLALIIGISHAENTSTSCNSSQIGSHRGSHYPSPANLGNHSTTPPIFAVAGPATAPMESYNSSHINSPFPAADASTTSPSQESCNTASIGTTYPATTAAYTVCTSAGCDSTTVQPGIHASTAPNPTLTVTTPGVSTTQSVSSVTTTKFVLELDTPGGPSSIPTNSSARSLSCTGERRVSLPEHEQ
jgi:hypothetical protein